MSCYFKVVPLPVSNILVSAKKSDEGWQICWFYIQSIILNLKSVSLIDCEQWTIQSFARTTRLFFTWPLRPAHHQPPAYYEVTAHPAWSWEICCQCQPGQSSLSQAFPCILTLSIWVLQIFFGSIEPYAESKSASNIFGTRSAVHSVLFSYWYPSLRGWQSLMRFEIYETHKWMDKFWCSILS